MKRAYVSLICFILFYSWFFFGISNLDTCPELAEGFEFRAYYLEFK